MLDSRLMQNDELIINKLVWFGVSIINYAIFRLIDVDDIDSCSNFHNKALLCNNRHLRMFLANTRQERRPVELQSTCPTLCSKSKARVKNLQRVFYYTNNNNTNGSPNLGRTDLVIVNKRKEKLQNSDFLIPADHRVKLEESEKSNNT